MTLSIFQNCPSIVVNPAISGGQTRERFAVVTANATVVKTSGTTAAKPKVSLFVFYNPDNHIT
jgi:hypothetical protein